MEENRELHELINQYSDTVYRVALNYLKHPADAEDITQNVMEKLISCEKEFSDESHRKYWLIRVTVNECKNFFRSFWRRYVTGLEDYSGSVPFPEPVYSDVYEAVMKLPPKYRIAVYLYYYEEYSVSEIAGITGCSETAVQTRLMRARARLKEQLKGVWNDDE